MKSMLKYQGAERTEKRIEAMTYYAVIDTNVVVSALLKEGSAPWQVLNEALNGCIIPVLNSDILNEYGEVLLRSKFGFSEQNVLRFITELPKRAIFINANPTDEKFPDPDDAVFYEVVMQAREKENAYLVTGNIKHFPVKSFVVTPREMLDIIRQNES